MKRRAFVYIEDDRQVGNIEKIAAQLQSAGMQVTDIAAVAGLIEGLAEEENIESLKHEATVLGGRFVPADEDMGHEVPDVPGDSL